MKTYTAILWLALAAGLFAQQTGQVRIAWDPNAASDNVTKYTVYEKVGTVYTKLQDVLPTACTAVQCNAVISPVVPGVHTFVVTASNIWESGYSNEASSPPVPGNPRNVILQITIIIS